MANYFHSEKKICVITVSSLQVCCDGHLILPLEPRVQPIQVWPLSCTQDLRCITLHTFVFNRFPDMLVSPLGFPSRLVRCLRWGRVLSTTCPYGAIRRAPKRRTSSPSVPSCWLFCQVTMCWPSPGYDVKTPYTSAEPDQPPVRSHHLWQTAAVKDAWADLCRPYHCPLREEHQKRICAHRSFSSFIVSTQTAASLKVAASLSHGDSAWSFWIFHRSQSYCHQ